MWSGLLPAGVTESELSEEDETEAPPPEGAAPEPVTEQCRQKFLELQRKRCELEAESSRRERKRKRRRKGKKIEQRSSEKATSTTPGTIPALETLQKYFGANDHLDPPVCQKVLKKSRLEENLDAAVTRGDIEEAEELSDRLATRELAVKVTQAASCHRYLQAKEEEAASQEGPRKRKNLPWGFEAKQRWETKSNMGYM
ncbi:protein FAM204A [Gastrophryne carolinensis]